MILRSTTLTLRFSVSNIKPTALERAMEGLKTVLAPPVSADRRPREENLFRTAAEQEMNQINGYKRKPAVK